MIQLISITVTSLHYADYTKASLLLYCLPCHTEIYLYTYLNLTPMSLELISLAVDSMTPPNKPPPLRPRAPIISAERLIIYIRNPTKKMSLKTTT
jgi:hypothetical protein